MATLPPWVHEPVTIVESDPGWADAATRLGRTLDEVLEEWRLSPVEHIGSTSVPGLAAKPILDLQALVESWDVIPAIEDRLAADDWHLVPAELDRRPERRFLIHVRDDRRHAHLHLMRPGEPRFENQRRFRDALRDDPALVARYAALKRELSTATADREQYTEAKAGFVAEILRRGLT